MVAFDVPEVDFDRYTNRQLAAVPLAVLGVALAILVAWYLLHGTPVALSIDFTGGTELTVQTATPQAQIPSAFSAEPVSVQAVSGQPNQYIVTFQSTNSGALTQQATNNLQPVSGDQPPDVVQSQRSTSAVFGERAQQTALLGLVVAFAGMSALAFLLFRTFVPSVAIVLSAFADIVIPLALMDVFGIPLSLGTVAALLMLIGYSVDSDILLTNHVLRRSGDFYESAYRSMRTGVTMTVTSIAAMIVMALLAFYFGIELLTSMGLVIFFGLTADLMNTYLLNVSLLRYYKYEGIAQ